ncbi:MAG: glycosyltransferase family 4 protein [Bacteroidota bacterium]
MEILVVSHKYPPSIGGMQKQCYELVEGLKRNHTVHTLIHKDGTSKFMFLLRSSFEARALLANKKIGLIYANDGLMAFFLTPLFWMTKVPIAVTAHGLDVVFPLKIYQRWLRKYFNKCKAVIAVSDGTTEELQKRDLEPDRVFTVRNGFDPDFRPPDIDFGFRHRLEKRLGIDLTGKKLMVSIGRSVQRKGFSWMIREVLPQLPDNVVYVIIGPTLGSYDKVEKMQRSLPKSLFNTLVLLEGMPLDEIAVHHSIQELGFADRVFHITDMSNEEVASTLAESDLFVMPNIRVDGDYEGFGLVALESVSAGTLCVASKVDGIPSAITEDKNGILLPPGDVQAWTDRLKALLSDDTTRTQLAKKYREYTMTHVSSWRSMADEYEKVFEKVLSKA